MTTVTERGLAHEWFGGCEYINPDTIARDEFGDWNSESAVRRAANVAQERRERAVRERRSLAFETVFSGVDKVEFLRAALHPHEIEAIGDQLAYRRVGLRVLIPEGAGPLPQHLLALQVQEPWAGLIGKSIAVPAARVECELLGHDIEHMAVFEVQREPRQLVAELGVADSNIGEPQLGGDR
jgi:hypothetical protein